MKLDVLLILENSFAACPMKMLSRSLPFGFWPQERETAPTTACLSQAHPHCPVGRVACQALPLETDVTSQHRDLGPGHGNLEGRACRGREATASEAPQAGSQP